MGIYLNPGKQRFEMAVNSEIFVDKTGMIRYLNTVINTNQRFVSVSRPRRFGKTMAADMLCAYYGHTADSRALFSQMKIAESEPAKVGRRTLAWDDYLGKFDVIRIVMTRFLSDEDTVKDSLNKLQKAVIRDIRLSYPDIDLFGENNIGENNVAENNILQVMEDVYTVTNRQFVVIIDEWDAVFREKREDKDGQKCYLDFLRNWLKDNECVALAYITGILPIKKYGKHSALNMFDEYSMVQPMQMAMYTGFTEEEVKTLCREYEMEYSEISDWYDGYALHDQIPVNKRRLFRQGQYTDHKISVYSPLSVVKAMRNGLVDNYWNKTETYEALAEYIKMNYDGLKIAVSLLMDGGRVPVDLSTYQNDMSTFHRKDDILALLIHLGYLGFEGKEADGVVDFVHGSVFIPNKEILEEFKASTKAEEWEGTFALFRLSQEILKATWNRDEEKVAELLEATHNKAGNKTYNNEAALSYSIQLAFYAAQKFYTILPELDSGKGYADVVYIPAPGYTELPVLLVELKYEKDADTAISQIKRQKYPDRLEHYKGNILLIGINYDKDIDPDDPSFKHHQCRIEEA